MLGENGDTFLERVAKLDSLIASRPGTVIIGVSFCDLTFHSNDLDDRFLLRLLGKPISNEYKFLFNDKQLELSFETPLERFFDKRKFIISSTNRYIQDILFKGEKSSSKNHLSRYPDSYISNFKDPWVHIKNRTEVEKGEQLKEQLKYEQNLCSVVENSNQQKNALQYIIKKLRQNNIQVIIINMPITPNFSNVISESTRHNFSKILNSTGVQWYDFEKEYSSEYFTDIWHLNVAGRTEFSSWIATVLIDYFIKGA